MKPVSEMSDEEFERRALAAIHRELGPGGVVRFLMEFRSGSGDYTRDRHLWQDGLTLDEIIAEIKQSAA